MQKKVSIDDILAENSLELTIAGKVYYVKDFDLADFLRVVKGVNANNPEEHVTMLRDQLAKALDCEPEDLEGLGMKSLMITIKTIQEWIVGEAQEVTGTPAGNP
jgi:hypothetical protein